MGSLIQSAAIARKLRADLKSQIILNQLQPVLRVISFGKDEVSNGYFNSIKKQGTEIGIKVTQYNFQEKATIEQVEAVIKASNNDDCIHGILIMFPVPSHINVLRIKKLLSPKKDIDCLTPENVGLMYIYQTKFLPCVATSIITLLHSVVPSYVGMDCLIINRSNTIGKPLSAYFADRHATVTIAHSQTKNLVELCGRADVIVTATGTSGVFTPEMVKQDVIIIDAGTHYEDGKIIGDIDYKDFIDHCKFVSSVPNGVGTLTTTMLLTNCIEATKGAKHEKN